MLDALLDLIFTSDVPLVRVTILEVISNEVFRQASGLNSINTA